ncbi:YtpI family protein [Bacillus shivajii]|uniref:YtpI family protein n=1 Tax=Bacillus shivajii TaxID=1983719 RepID=UPI001CFB1301|nr:YtpI family protein [Bacillus shivajii]UCZ52269.1 YtpI family protein [Bacillus shivajii]
MIWVLLIFTSLVLFVYFKVQQARARGMMEKRWYASKGSIAVGIFFISFAINAYSRFGTTVAAFVALFFFAFGLINVIFGIRFYKTYLPYARQEVEEMKKEEINKN